MPHIIDLDFATIQLFDSYVIATIREGVVFDEAEKQQIHEIFTTFYPNQPFGYISNRVFDYSVNPTCYLDADDCKNLVGMAILCHSEKSFQMAHFEKSFNERPFEVFCSLKDSIDWIQHRVRFRLLSVLAS